MPYIKKERRAALDTIIDGLISRLRSIDTTKGDLNYTVTRLVLGALRPAKGWTYTSLSDAIAALQDAADEIKSRVLVQYEEYVRVLNGDLVEFVQAETDIDDKYEAYYRPSSGPVEKLAAEGFQDLQDEIKETLERR